MVTSDEVLSLATPQGAIMEKIHLKMHLQQFWRIGVS